MGTPRQTVQHSDRKCGVSMAMFTIVFVGVSMPMSVQVNVFRSIVFVLVRVNIMPEGTPQGPDTDTNQNHTDEALAPG